MKNLGLYLTLSIMFLFGIFFTIYGIEYNKKEENFKKSAGKVTAKIYQNTISNHKQVLYIRYYVNGEEYNGVVSSYRHQRYGSNITIYYNKKKPTEYIIDTKNYIGYLFMFLGISLIIISCSFVIRMLLD